MPRPDRSKWADSTPVQIAFLVRGSLERPVLTRSHPAYSPANDSKLSSLFAASDTSYTYNPLRDSASHLLCAGPSCSAKMKYIPASQREGDLDRNRAHFSPYHSDDHAAGCAFRNERPDRERPISRNEAIEKNLPVLVNLNFNTGHFGAVPVSEGRTEHQNWVDTTGAEGYRTEPVHSIGELIALRDWFEKKGGKAALENIWYNKNTMMRSHEHFWLAKEADEMNPGDTRHHNPAMRPILNELADRAADPRMASQEVVYGATRLIDIDLESGRRVYDARERKLHAAPLEMRAGMAPLLQDIRFLGLEGDGHNTGDTRKFFDRLLHENGHRLRIVASPSLRLPFNAAARAIVAQDLRRLAGQGTPSISGRQPITITWTLWDDYALQYTQAPARPRATQLSLIPAEPFVSGVAPDYHERPKIAASGVKNPVKRGAHIP